MNFLLFSAAKLYATLCLVSVTLHVSTKYPTPKNPLEYDLNTCSGVFISPNEVLTAGHCVSHSRGRQWIKTEEGESYAAVIEAKDLVKDLALLKIKGVTHSYVSFGGPVNITDKVYTVNSGDSIEKTFNEGIVNNLFAYDVTETFMILHSATIFPGASGSGLFNSNGELVGINTDTIKSLAGAVDITVIKQFLKRR